MIRSQLRSALRRCPTEEGAGPAGAQWEDPGEPAGGGAPVAQLQSLIAQRMQRAQELLEEMRLQVRGVEPQRGGGDTKNGEGHWFQLGLSLTGAPKEPRRKFATPEEARLSSTPTAEEQQVGVIGQGS